MKVLIVGPLPSVLSDSEIVGGAKVSFEETVRQLRARGFELDIINSSRPYQNLPLWKVGLYSLRIFLRVIWSILIRIRHSQLVFLNIVPYAAWILGPSIWIICKVARRPMALRFFGGSFREVYRGYGPMIRWLADRTFIGCPIVFVQTKQLCQDFHTRGHFRWLPNTRDIEAPATSRQNKVRKLVFISQLRMEKGLAETLTACRSLPEGCHLQVFGPRHSNTDLSLLEDHPRATYGGVVELAEVPRVLGEHDLLLLPTYYKGEGYPGIILEAFQCGIPVIATRWGAISEIVEHEESGLLVEPGSASDLEAAIQRLLEDPDMYQRLCRGARHRGEFFRSTNWYDQVAAGLRSLV